MACNNKNCGCQDTGLTTPALCSSPACPNPEPCPETFSDCCVIHNSDTYTYLTKEVTSPFTVYQGERLCDTLQRFIAYTYCQSTVLEAPYGFKSNSITATTINVSWTPLTGASYYEVYYVVVNPLGTDVLAGTVTANTTPNFTITGLTANTQYYVYVLPYNENEDPGCASVSLILTTKSA